MRAKRPNKLADQKQGEEDKIYNASEFNGKA